MSTSFLGYARADGGVGVRDHLLVLPLAASWVPLAERVAREVPGAVAVAHEFEAAESEGERERVRRTLVGTAGHPNVRFCVAIGDSYSDAGLLDAIARLDRAATIDVAALRSRAVAVDRAVSCLRRGSEANRCEREPLALSHLVIGTECGGSDAWSGVTANPALGVASDWLAERGATIVLAETTELIGAELLLVARAASADVAARILEVVGRYEAELAAIGEDIRGAQPTVGNMLGGLTTIEEKALGAAKKAGTGPIHGVVEFAKAVPSTAGVVIMDTPGHDIEQMTGVVAGGCQIVAFTTGRGAPTGSPIAPTLKIASTSEVFARLRSDLDVDAGAAIDGAGLASVGLDIADWIVRCASGELTSAERRGTADFALSRFPPGAGTTFPARSADRSRG